jgi:predicted esterase
MTGGSIERSGIVALHGRGGSRADVLGLLAHVSLPGVTAVAPEAPGQSWWPASFLVTSAVLEPHVARGVATVADAVAGLEGAGIPRARIWLLGFSQGAVLAAEAYARIGTGLAGALAFSGALAGSADAPGGPDPALYGHRPKRFDYAGRRTGKVWLSVHESDPHIPLARARQSADVLRSLGAETELKIFPGAGHAVMRDDLAALARLAGG